VPYRPYSEQNCSIADALAVLGERWTLLIMREVLLGRRRFADIRDETGVATNILSDRLQTLVGHELLTRERYGEHPEAFEYRTTKKGDDTWPVLAALLAWGDAYGSVGGSPRVIVHTRCGHDADLRLHCSHCGEPVTTSELVTRPGPGANDKQRADGMLPSSRRWT
jgi:DNA-binding HxlR family transcriptional regulator